MSSTLSEIDDEISKYSRAIEKCPFDADLYCRRGAKLVELGFLVNGIADLDHAVVLDPSLAEAYFWRAHCHDRHHETASAASCYNKAVSLAPDEPRYRLAREVFNWNNRKINLALRDFNAGIEKTATMEVLFAARGRLLFYAKGDWKAANRDFETALRLNQESTVCYEVGLIEYAESRFDSAITCFLSIFRRKNVLDAEYAAAFLFLCRLLTSNEDVAIKELQSAFPNIRKTKDWPMPVLQYFLGQTDGAILLRDAQLVRPRPEDDKEYQSKILFQSQIAHFFIGEALRAKGMHAKAIDHLRSTAMTKLHSPFGTFRRIARVSLRNLMKTAL